MSQLPIVIVVVVAVFAAWVMGAWLRGGPQVNSDSSMRDELHQMLISQAQGFAAQMAQLNQVVTQQLGEVRQELGKGPTSAGGDNGSNDGRLELAEQLRSSTEALARLTQQVGDVRQDLAKRPASAGGSNDGRPELAEQLRTSTEALTRLTQQLGDVQQSGRELTQTAHVLQTVLGGAKSRGSLGEVTLENVLADAMPGGSYDLRHRFGNGACADAVIRAGNKLIAIDAKFPMDAYRRLAENGEGARGDFAQAARNHVDSVATDYIVPGEGTPNLALMFVPSESAFREMLLTGDGNGRLDEYCRAKNVLAVSPNSLHAYLGAILAGLRGTELEGNMQRMLASLEELKSEFDEFAEIHGKLGRQIQNTRGTYDEADRRLHRARTAMGETAQRAKALSSSAPEMQEEEATALAAVAPSNNGA